MKRNALTLFLATLLLLTGCITIEESYTFHADGSGTMDYTIDLTAFAEMMSSMENLEDAVSDEEVGKSEEEEDFLKEVKAVFAEKIEQLKSIDGISRVGLTEGKGEYVYAFSYDFKDLTALNKALNVLLNETEETEHTFFKASGKKLTRQSILGDIGKELSATHEDSDEMGKEMAEMMLSEVHYNVNFVFEKGLKSVKTDGNGTLSDDKQTYQLKATLMDLINNPEVLNAQFKTK